MHFSSKSNHRFNLFLDIYIYKIREGKQSKNLQKFNLCWMETYGGKKSKLDIQLRKKREVGDKWTDSEGYEWEQKEGFI